MPKGRIITLSLVWGFLSGCYVKHSGNDLGQVGGLSSEGVLNATLVVEPQGPTTDNQPTIRWTEVVGAVKYHVFLADAPSKCDPKTSRFLGESKTLILKPSKPLSDKKYFVCVQTFFKKGNSLSKSQEFTIDTRAPGNYSIVTPTDPTNEDAPLVSWTTPSGGDTKRYLVRIGNKENCPDQSRFEETTTNSLQWPDVLAEGEHYVCVEARDSADNGKKISKKFKVDRTPSGEFSMSDVKPVYGNLNPSFAWSPSSEAVRYLVQIKGNGCATLVQEAVVTSTNYTASPALENLKSYCIEVTAFDDAGNTRMAKGNKNFRINNAQPTNWSFNKPGNFSNNPVFTVEWTTSQNAVEYEILLATDSNCTNTVFSKKVGKDTRSLNIPSSAKLSDRVYYLCGNASAEGGNVTKAAGMQVELDTDPPKAFQAIAPTGTFNATKPSVVWTASAGAHRYRITIGSPSCKNPIVQTTVLAPATQYHPPSDLPEGKIAVCLVAEDKAGNTFAANTLNFEIDRTAPKPVSDIKPSGHVNQATFNVTWKAPESGLSYKLLVTEKSDCTAPLSNQQYTTTNTSQTLTSPLPKEGTYFLCVKAIDKANNQSAFAKSTITYKAIRKILTGAGPGGGPHVMLREGTNPNKVYASFMAYGTFAGGVYVASGDVNCDGTPDIITGAGAGGGPHVKAYNGKTFKEMYSFFAYTSAFTGGVRVAAGDVDGDGCDDIITAAGPGGGPHVRVLKGGSLAEIASFFAYTPAFLGGVFVASGDINKDGKDEVITGADAGGGPHVIAFAILPGNKRNTIHSFFAYDSGFRGGVRVGSADINNDGIDDIITGAGPGGGPHVRVRHGQNLQDIASFFAYATAFTGGVFVSGGDVNGDGVDDIITGADAGGGSHVIAFSGKDPLAVLTSFFAYPGFGGGVRVSDF